MELTKVALILGVTLLTLMGGAHYLKSQEASSIIKMSDFGSLRVPDIAERISLFRDWMQKHNKNYGASEAITRFMTWSKTYDFVQEHNAKGLSWEVEVNKFADLTNEEFSAMYLGFNYDPSKPRHFTYLDEDDTKPSSEVDWRKKGVVNVIQDQGQCGSCWSFSANAALEALNSLKGGTLTKYSEQQLVDCSSSYGNQGCNGGLMDNAFKYVQEKGVEKQADYPYKGTNGTCRYSASKVVYKNKGYTDVPENNPTQLKAAISKQVVSVAIEADQDVFKNYKSGIITSGCGTDLDHGVAAVGYGSNYILVRNSWGTSWGDQGYVKIASGSQNDGAGVCGINKVASYPTA